MIKAGIEAGQVRRRAWYYKERVAGDPNIEEPAFWRVIPGGQPPRFNWGRSSVRRMSGGWEGKGYVAHQVEVLQEDIDALIAAWKTPPSGPTLTPAPADVAKLIHKPPRPRKGLKQRVYDMMDRNPPREGERDYARMKIWENLPDDEKGGTLKRVQNIVSHYRKAFERP
jgi:hypothetical protein